MRVVIAALLAIAALRAEIPLKAIFYKTSMASFWGELADDTGPSPTPREYALWTINQNFQAIAAGNANSIVVYLPDEDSWQSQYGGGFSYDPVRRPKPQFAIAQELLITLAAKHNLRVIFQVNPSTWHMSNVAGGSDLYGNTTGGPADYPGAYAFVHALIAPASYYGNLWTTRLQEFGLLDHQLRDFTWDKRIAGWYFGGEWFMQQPAQKEFFVKYWPWFYGLVHYGRVSIHPRRGEPATGQFAAVYPGGWPVTSPDSVDCDPARLSMDRSGAPAGDAFNFSAFNSLEQLKKLFMDNPALPRPDLWAFEWYGTSNGLNTGPPAGYRLSCIASDINAIAAHMSTYGFPVPLAAIGLHEGGTDYAVDAAPGQPQDVGANQFYLDAVSAAGKLGLRQIAVWGSDGQINTGACALGPDYPLTVSRDNGFMYFSALFELTVLDSPQCRLWLPDQQFGWNDGSTVYTTAFAADYGYSGYSGLTGKGLAVAAAFAAH